MSYEICAFDSAVANSREAAFAAWDQSSYWDTSQADSERSARKWRIKEALQAFDPGLRCDDEPQVPATGFLAKAFSKAPKNRRYLNAYLEKDDEIIASFCILDQAVEIDLDWVDREDQIKEVVREVWRHLEKLSQLGFSTIYDTERDALINLEADFDVVLQNCLKIIDSEETDEAFNETAPSAAQKPDAGASVSQQPTPQVSAQPFAGNIAESKPWWKFW